MSENRLIYLDNNATTPTDPRAVEAMLPYFYDIPGNAASRNHPFGWKAEEAVEYAREQIADLIGADPKEIIFTSGATESDNLAIKGVFEMYASKGNHIITIKTEHKAVLDACKKVEKMGGEVTYLDVQNDGMVDLNLLESSITDKTILISIMWANNETGVIQQMKAIGDICKKHGVLFMSDATQAVGKIPVFPKEVGVHLMAFTSHKMYGQNTTQGGTHLGAFREAIVKTFRDFYKKEFDSRDVQTSVVAAISLKVEEPVFESQTKTKLGSQNMVPDGVTIRSFVLDFMKTHLGNFLYKNKEVADAILKKILQSERERKEIADIKKVANQRAKKANIHNKKLRDCRAHLTDNKKVEDEIRLSSTIFITEGDSASGSITKARNVQTQAVFSLRGKPLNCYGMTKKVVYQNEELNLLQHALDIEDGIENLRYNRVVIATDADVDGMHIRLLLLTFFLQFFPDLVKHGHLYILDTPLFRVRDKQKTFYCYSEQEKQDAIKKLRGKAEITRFKGLGEISPNEFEDFIGEDIRLEPVILGEKTKIEDLLSYYMGKNTPERQVFIIDNLKIELDQVAPDEEEVMDLATADVEEV